MNCFFLLFYRCPFIFHVWRPGPWVCLPQRQTPSSLLLPPFNLLLSVFFYPPPQAVFFSLRFNLTFRFSTSVHRASTHATQKDAPEWQICMSAWFDLKGFTLLISHTSNKKVTRVHTTNKVHGHRKTSWHAFLSLFLKCSPPYSYVFFHSFIQYLRSATPGNKNAAAAS